jgi:hypothetical protein
LDVIESLDPPTHFTFIYRPGELVIIPLPIEIPRAESKTYSASFAYVVHTQLRTSAVLLSCIGA